jgi:hypothetical protein
LFFDEKKENNDKFEEIKNQKNKEPLNLNKKENKIPKIKFEIKREKNEKEDENLNENISSKSIFEDRIDKNGKESVIIIDKNYKELIQSRIKKNLLSKRPFKEKKVLGRKKKENEGLGEHNKFSDDNIIRKIKHVILDSVMKFINKKSIIYILMKAKKKKRKGNYLN